MFPMDIANSGNQQMVYRNNQPPQPRQQHQMPQHHLQQQHHQMPQQQMFPSHYGYQQQQPYLAYPSTAGPNAGKGAMDFIPSQQYMPQQQMFPYGYTQQHQSPLNQQFFPSVMAPQTQPPPPPMRYNQQGNSNSTNQYMGGHAGGHPRYHGGRGRGGMHSGYGGQFHRQVHNNYFYNQQHHYSSNNAVPEKTPTVHLIHPETKKIISIKLNRIYSTMADIRPQLHQQSHSNGASASNVPSVLEDSKSEKASKSERPKEKSDSSPAPKFDPKTTKLVLCLSFLSPKGCMHGSGCDKVHIAGLEYTWPQVEAKEVKKEGKKAYSAGFFVHCYDPTLTRYYKVPSGSVYMTKGSADYVNMFNDHGDNFKMKFKLCAPMLEGAECEKGEECEDIHCSVADLEAVRENSANATHINNIEAMADVPRLPADMTVRVFNQNSFDTWRDYPGGNLLITEGAKAYQKQYEQEMNSVPTRKRMQHCAHFRLKDMCRLGESCRFLHVLPTEQELKERKDAEAAEAAAQAAAKAMEGVAGEGIMKSDEKDAGVTIE